MDSVSPKLQSVEVKQPPTTTPVEPVAAAPEVAAPAEPTIAAQASEAIPEIDQARTANRELASAWTSLAASEDGTVSAPEEVDWSAWERAERGLPAPGGEATPPAEVPSEPVVRDGEVIEPAPVEPTPRISPRDWTPEGYRTPEPGTLRTADMQLHQVAPGVWVDDNWGRVNAPPPSAMFDMDGNPIARPDEPVTGLPEGWKVDEASGDILDAQGQRVNPRPVVDNPPPKKDLPLGSVMEDIAQRFSSLRIGTGGPITPPLGKVVLPDPVSAPRTQPGVIPEVEVPAQDVLRQMTPEEQAAYEAAERTRQLERSLQISPKVGDGEPVYDPDTREILGHWAQGPGGGSSSLEFRPARPIDAPTGILSGEAVIDPQTGELLGNWHQSPPEMADIAYLPGEEPPTPPYGPLEFLPVGWLERLREQPAVTPVEPAVPEGQMLATAVADRSQLVDSGTASMEPSLLGNLAQRLASAVPANELLSSTAAERLREQPVVTPVEPAVPEGQMLATAVADLSQLVDSGTASMEPSLVGSPAERLTSAMPAREADTAPATSAPDSTTGVSTPTSAAPTPPAAPPIPKEIPATLQSVAEYRRYEEYLKSVKGEMDTVFQQNYEYEPEALPARGIRSNVRQTMDSARDQILADFVDEKTGLTYRDINKIQDNMTVWKDQLLNRERPPSAAYGLNARDQELQANPQIAEMQARFQAHMAAMPPFTERWETESGSGESVRPATEDELKAYAATLVDPVTGVSGSDLFHLDRSIQEKRQGDLAMNKLEFYKVGSFTGDTRVTDIDASRVFGVIGRDQRAQLMAEQATSPMGVGYLLEGDGNLLLPSHRDPSGPWFISAMSASDLAATGVINVGHGGYNLEGLAMNGSAHIGTVRPNGGLFGGLLNSVARILPGGKIGELVGDAVSDINHAINQPASSFLRFVGEDKDDFATQVIGHQEATTNVLAHAGETRGDTFATLVRDTAQYAEVTQVANTVGNALIATGVGAAVGAAIVVGTGAMLAGYQQLQGDKDADGNQGIGQALTTFAVSAITAGIGNGVTSSLGTATSTTAAGVTTTTVAANTASTFVSSTVNSVVSQAVTTGDVDLGEALAAGALGAVGFNTQIAPGLNAVTLYNMGQALADGDANAIASLGTSAITGLSGAQSIYSGIQNQGLTTTTPDLRGLGEGDEQVANPGTTAPAQNSAPTAGAAPGPVADDPEVGGPQSGGGPEAPEAGAGERPIQRPPDALDRAAYSAGSVVTEGPRGSTVITGPDGTVRTVHASGAVVEVEGGSNRYVVTGATRGQAFEAARAQGLAVFEWNGRPYHTGREDQLNVEAQRLLAANPVLANLTEAERLQLVANATSQHALNVFRSPDLPNEPGMDSRVIAAGLAMAESLGQARQETDRLAARFPVPIVPLPDNTSAGGLFNEGGESGGVPVPNPTPRQYRMSDQEVWDIVAQRLQEFGPLPPRTQVRTLEEAGATVERVQQMFPNLDRGQILEAARRAFYSDDGEGRNTEPMFDRLLPPNRTNPEMLAATRIFIDALPAVVQDGDQLRTNLAHILAGGDPMFRGNAATALLFTHGGDAGQVALGVLDETISMLGQVGPIVGRSLTTVNAREAQQILDSADPLIRDYLNRVARLPEGVYSADQFRGNNAAFALARAMSGGLTLSQALQYIGQPTLNQPILSPEEGNKP